MYRLSVITTSVGLAQRTRLTLIALGAMVMMAVCAEHGSAQPFGSRSGLALVVRPVLVGVLFTGNTAFDDATLQLSIQSRPTTTSSIHNFFQSFARLFDSSTYAPEVYRDMFRKLADSTAGELRYLNMQTVLEDTLVIHSLYQDAGYHDVSLRYHISLDTARNVCILKYIINEGPQYVLGGIGYVGIESLPKELRQKIITPQAIQPGQQYSTDKLTAEAARILGVLRDSGYAFATQPRRPLVLQMRPTDGVIPEGQAPRDTAILSFYPGTRYRFGRTILVPTSKSRLDSLHTGTILMQLDYKQGEWYNKRKLDQSVANLYALSVFDLVKFDTVAPESTQDTLVMRLATRMREQNDLTGGIGLEYSASQGTFILGLNGSYNYSNMFSTASSLAFGVNLGLQFKPISLLYGVNATFISPTFFGLDRSISFVSRPIVEYLVEDEVADQKLYSLRARWPFELSMRQPLYTFFTSFSARLGLQYTRYSNVDNYIVAQAESQLANISRNDSTTDGTPCGDPDLKEKLLMSVTPALFFNVYRTQKLISDSANYRFGGFVGGSAVSDRRSDPFVPVSGRLLQIDMELGTAGFNSGYARLNLDGRLYYPAWPGSSWAFRAHAGVISEFGSGARLTPVANRFSAGGASSLRGWGSREMLVTSSITNSNFIIDPSLAPCVEPVLNSILNDQRRLLGGLAVLEFSAEWRLQQIVQAPNSSAVGRQLNQFGLVIFTDVGNAFFRDWKLDADLVNASTILENMAWDIGFSLGYSTPVGPFRFGFGYPLYDPVDQSHSKPERWFWNRPLTISNFTFHLAIGHAF